MQNKYFLKNNFILVLSLSRTHYVLASTTGGDLSRKPMNQTLNGAAEMPQAYTRNLEVEYLRR